jgi:hypothetical protein
VLAVHHYTGTRIGWTVGSGLDRNIASPKRLEISFKVLGVIGYR